MTLCCHPQVYYTATTRPVLLHRVMEYDVEDIEALGSDPIDLVVWLVNEYFLTLLQHCGQCGGVMNLEHFGNLNDAVVWRCENQHCRSWRAVLQCRIILLNADECTDGRWRMNR